jgi:ribosomal protein S12
MAICTVSKIAARRRCWSRQPNSSLRCCAKVRIQALDELLIYRKRSNQLPIRV